MWFVLILTSLLALSVASSPLLIDLPDGKIQGFKLNAYHAYRGIPYAAPPTGNNRWVPPQPVEPWKPAILSTTEFKANCLQPTPPCWYSINKAKESSEDCKCTLSPSLCKVRRITSLTRFDLFVCCLCGGGFVVFLFFVAPFSLLAGLYLDVYVPNVKSNENGQTDQNKLRSSGQNEQSRAVMVWIHGGDYQYGGSNDRETVHPPHYPEIANTIYVSVNYRLSVFGYLGAEQLRARDTLSGSTGNYGAQDQRAAIKWVKDHIGLFGGDPNRITIFGESAGAGSVTVQTIMPKSFGLFQRAITESGGFSQWNVKEMPRAQDNYNWVMGNLKLKPNEVDRLVGLPAHEILNAAQYWMPGCPWPDTMVQSQFAPTIDGVEITDHPSTLSAGGHVAPGVSVIFGSNRDEGTMFVSDNNYTHKQGHYSGANLPRDLNENQFYDFTYGSWGAIVGRMMESQLVYPLSCHRDPLEYELCDIGTYNTWWWAATRACGDFMMTCTARRAARQWTSFEHDAYNYYFSKTPEYSVNTYPTAPWGAFHGSEVPFVWDSKFELTGPAEIALSKKMVRYWSNFAKSGDPNLPKPSMALKKLPHWPKLETKDSDSIIRLATKKWEAYTSDFNLANISGIEGLRKKECDFWDVVNGYVVDPLPLSTRYNRTTNATTTSATTNRKYQTKLVQRPLTYGASKGWKILPNKKMPTPRTLFGMVTVREHQLYTVGGLSALSNQNRGTNNLHYDASAVEIFNARTRQWKKGPDLQHPRSGLGVVVVKDAHNQERIFAIGGMAGDPKATDFYAVPYVEMLTIGGASSDGTEPSRWMNLPNLPANRTEIAVVFCLGRIYVIGGAGATLAGATDSMWSLNVMKPNPLNKEQELLSTDEQLQETWRKEPGLPTLRAALTAGVVDNQIVVVGGMRGFLATNLDPDPLKTVDVFDPSTKKWKTDDEVNAPMHMPTGRHSPASVVVPRTLLLNKVGGDGGSRGITTKVQGLTTSMLVIAGGYSTKGDDKTTIGLVEGDVGSWVELPSLSVARMGLRMAYVGEKGGAGDGCMYAMGGMTIDVAHHDIVGSASPITGVVEVLCGGGAQNQQEL